MNDKAASCGSIGGLAVADTGNTKHSIIADTIMYLLKSHELTVSEAMQILRTVESKLTEIQYAAKV
jgi:hypothetical protein